MHLQCGKKDKEKKKIALQSASKFFTGGVQTQKRTSVIVSLLWLDWKKKNHLLWLNAIKNLLKCDGSIFNTVQVHKHQETCRQRKAVRNH